MDREQKIAYARRYSADLVAGHQGIAAIALGGSVARGNDLPISDLDLWCFVDSDSHPLPIKKHSDGDLYVDVAQRPASELTGTAAADDSYFCGYVHDALILHDRDGDLAKCQARARKHLSSPVHRERQLATVRESVERNRGNLAASANAHDAREACRTSIFAAWSMSDYMLVVKGVSPGGGRGLARLCVAWPEAADALIAFEGLVALQEDRVVSLIECYRGIADTGSFFTIWFEKVEWMLANGYRPDALHALWIALGIRLRDAKERNIGLKPEGLDQVCVRWLETIDWDWDTVSHKAVELQTLAERFCR